MEPEEILECEDFGMLLRHARKKFGLTQEFVSEESGVSRPMISNIELGKNKNPHLETVIRISRVINLGVFISKTTESNFKHA